MKKLLLLYFFLIFSQIILAQNIVPNPSFEDYDTCPNFINQVNYANEWTNMCSGSPDYYNKCADQISDVSIPNNGFGFQQAVNGGNAYCGLYTYYRNWWYNHSNYREYFGSQLQSSLNIGSKYFVSFYVNLANNASCATNNIGALFSTVPYYYNSYDSTVVSTKNFAHVNNSFIVSDTLNWILVTGSIIADSSYKYLIIGNFFDDNNTDTTISFNNCQAYYYIGDVCVSIDSLTCNLPDVINEINNEKDLINIYPNPTFDYIYINYKNYSINFINYSLFDVYGRFLMENKNLKLPGVIDVSPLSNGIYFLQIKSEYNFAIKKIIISKP